ncbi:hypothetical protein MKEN_00253800 [Mycena kentingensis (nom. inval.)]|nr:hypothetical protein MKEN_00253800 [Mycena kentingensis (nom. inval.)]
MPAIQIQTSSQAVQAAPSPASAFQPIVAAVAFLILVVVAAPMVYVFGARLLSKFVERREVWAVDAAERGSASCAVVVRARMSQDHKKVAQVLRDLEKVKSLFVELAQKEALESVSVVPIPGTPKVVPRPFKATQLIGFDVVPTKAVSTKSPKVVRPSPLRNVLTVEPTMDTGIIPVLDATEALQELLSSLDSSSAITVTPSPSAASLLSPSPSVVTFPGYLFSGSVSCSSNLSSADDASDDQLSLSDVNAHRSVPIPQIVVHNCADLPVDSLDIDESSGVFSPSPSLVNFLEYLFSSSVSYGSELNSFGSTSFLDATHDDDVLALDVSVATTVTLSEPPQAQFVVPEYANLPIIPDIVIHPAPVLALSDVFPGPLAPADTNLSSSLFIPMGVAFWLLNTSTSKLGAPSTLRASHATLRRTGVTLSVLAIILYQAPIPLFDPIPYRMFVQGGLNRPTEFAKPTSPSPIARHFYDFDLFTLQRSVADLEDFLTWREDESRRVFASPVVIGIVFQVERDALAAEQGVWRCPFPNPAIPSWTRDLVMRNPRPRQTGVDTIIASSPEPVLSFRVTKVVRHQQDTFSQVFFGILCSADGAVSKPVCLKLFVDTLFPIDKDRLFEDFDSDSKPCWRLQTLNCAEDLARREESAYQRLAEYQGTLLPHCYGFHRFTLNDRYNAYGALLEIVPGPQLADLELEMWSKPVQQGLVRQLRECLRALLYASVDQGDWYGGQILFPGGADYNPETDSLVLIDFAFAMQRLGDEQRHGVAANLQCNGHIELKIYLRKAGIPEDVLGACFGWDDLDTNEW